MGSDEIQPYNCLSSYFYISKQIKADIAQKDICRAGPKTNIERVFYNNKEETRPRYIESKKPKQEQESSMAK